MRKGFELIIATVPIVGHDREVEMKTTSHALQIKKPKLDVATLNTYTDLPAYSDTVYSDTPLIVTLFACPK